MTAAPVWMVCTYCDGDVFLSGAYVVVSVGWTELVHLQALGHSCPKSDAARKAAAEVQPDDLGAAEAVYARTHRTFCDYVRGLGDWRSCRCPEVPEDGDDLRTRHAIRGAEIERAKARERVSDG